MLRILNVAYPLAPVGRDAPGGAEQVLTAIDRALVAAGHESIVVAPAGSRCQGELVALPPVPTELGEAERAAAEQACARAVADTCRRRAVDVVHLHGIDCHTHVPPGNVPLVVTLHLPFAWYVPSLFTDLGARATFVSVSLTQRRTLPPWLQGVRTIPNGVDVDRLPRRDVRVRPFVLALGRVCPEKGFHIALDAAARAGLPLVLAGRLFPYPAHVEYFERMLAPRIRRMGARWLGPVGLARKRRLLSSARCLVVPSLVEETSCLVAMEALACGTPVVARRTGALPEVIDHGRTGFLVTTEAEMADAILETARLDRDACREAARRRFDARTMTSRYLALYDELARTRTGVSGEIQERAAPGPPATDAGARAPR